MNRSPLFYPLIRGWDMDGGGAAELQTDVMRFMAIISLCLVAIFALVQSIPTPDATTAEIKAKAALPATPPAAVAETPVLQRPASLARPEAPAGAEVETVELTRPTPPPTPAIARPTAPTPAAMSAPRQADVEPTSSNASAGFTLRFESDNALTGLVAQGVVGLYALSPDGAYRLHAGAADAGFWRASLPEVYHEMDAATVPASVLAAWRRAVPTGVTATTWGVSIPATMSEQLNRHLSGLQGGELVIGLDGTVRVEQ